MATVEERFWAKVDKIEGGCWVWIGGFFRPSKANPTAGGYGAFSPNQPEWPSAVPAHRYAWFLRHGKHPGGSLLHHACRNRACVNPDHLVLTDDYADHMQHHRKTHCIRGHELVERGYRQICPTCRREQMRRKREEQRGGRPKYEGIRGDDNPRSKLTEAKVREIKGLLRSGASGKALAERYGVSQVTISMIRHGHQWSWVE